MRIVIFILLKIIEIVVLIFVPYWLGKLVGESGFVAWMAGLFCLVIGGGIAGLVIYWSVIGNWKLSQWIIEKLRS